MAERHRVIPDVHVLLTDSGGRVLLMERANTGYADGLVGLPSGHVEPGESVVEAAIREVKEEIGVDIDPGDLRFAHVCHRRREGEHDRVGFFFTATRWTGEPTNREPHKCAGVWWAHLDDLPDATMDYLADAIARLRRSAEVFSTFGWNGRPPTG